MGTKVQCESYFPGYFSMRDLNEDSNSCSWPLYYGDKTFTNGQYYTGFLPRSLADAYTGYDKDVVKRTMLEHEATFKKQLYELHRLYRIQRDMMDDIKRKELHKSRTPVETSFASSPLASQITSEDARKWHMASFPLANSVCARPSASGLEDIHSPLSSMKGDSKQASPLQSQNGVISKDLEMLESRPSKVRRKMFDLQLPADEYIDTEEEELRDENASGISKYLPNGNHKIVPESGTNLFIGNGGKNNFQGDSSRSASCLRSTSNVADLNEPVEVEEIKNPVYVDRVGSSSHGEIRGHEIDAKPKSQFLAFPKEISLNPHHGSANGAFSSTHLQYSASGRQVFSPMLEAGHNKNNLLAVSQCQQEKSSTSSQPIQNLLKKTHESPTLFLTEQSKINQLRETTIRGLDFSERNREISNSTHPESVVTSHFQSPYPTPPELGKTWSQSASSWEKSNGGLSQKWSTSQSHPFLNSSATLSRSSQSSNQSHGMLGDRWNYNSNSASNPSFGNEMLGRNGFCQGSSSGTKEFLVSAPSGSHDYINGNIADNLNSERINNHSSAKFFESSNCMDSKSAKDGNFNMRHSNSSSNKVASRHGIQVIDLERKQEDHLVGLPWLRAKPAYKNGASNTGVDLNAGELSFLEASLNQLSGKAEPGESPIQMVMQNTKSASCVKFEACRTEISDSASCRKILGVPILEKEKIVKNESSLTSPSVSLPVPSEREVDNGRKNGVLDINLPCDPAVPDLGQQSAAEVDLNVCSSRHLFDLNSCVSEDEVSLMPLVLKSSANVVGIDLEAPAAPEVEEDGIPADECLRKAYEEPIQGPQLKDGSPREELVRVAAEAIVAISLIGHNHVDDATSNRSEGSMTDPLHWFVEIAASCGEDLESKLEAASIAKYGEENESSSSEEIDYFESMTLKLAETTEEDYMPKPLVPETLKLEETATTPLPTRTRRGQARRGRQRRDFQRDILPGLASLSRHEVTEDLQTFGGMMRAKGHSWHSGLMRRNSTRNGCARGRRRAQVSPAPAVTATIPCAPLVQQLTTIEVLALEDRSLTGWGKTTRRPRRQRCPAGNPPPIPLT